MMPNRDRGGPSPVCPVCGSALKGETVHCSVGCALAGRIPMDEKNLPASVELLVALLSGLVLFNQMLFWGLGLAKIQRGELASGENALVASLVAGLVWLGGMAAAWITHAPKRREDYFIGLLAILFLAIAGTGLVFSLSFTSCLVVANLLLSISLYRGIAHLWRASKKREK